MAGITKKKRKGGTKWYITLSPNQAEDYGFARKAKWIGPYDLKEDAVKARDELRRTVKDVADSNSLTLVESYRIWIDSADIRDSTRDLYKACWEHLQPLSNRKMKSIKLVEIEDLLNGLSFSRSRVKSIRTLLNHCFNNAVRLGAIDASPMSAVRVKYRKPSETKKLKFWDQDQAQTFLKAAKRSPCYSFYHLALHTGMRRGELLGLKWEYVDFDSNKVTVAGSWSISYGYGPTKTGNVRSLSLRDKEMQILEDLHYEGFEYVFQRHTEKTPWAVQGVQQDFTRTCDFAGVPHIGLHGLRHTYATVALAAGEKIEVVANRLGHSSTDITRDVYRHIIPIEDEQIAEKVGSLFD